jgi:hypothetical protein
VSTPMRQLEARTQGMLSPNRFKEVELLKNIAETKAKIELAGEMFRAKGTMNNIGMPPPGSVKPRPDDLAVFASFDAVDRNLAQAATEHVINMFRVRDDRSGRATSSGAREGDLGGMVRH